jgi:hypothetical protein
MGRIAFLAAVGLVVVLGSAAVHGAEVGKLVGEPKLKKQGEKVEIAFEVSGPTDVEVAILGQDGKVARHLAAGVLGGKNPPPAPLGPGLSQKLVWDGNDDSGKPAAGGPFRARIRAGMSVQFGRMIGDSPYTGSVATIPFRAPVNGLVVDERGQLYVKLMSAVGSHGNSGLWPWQIRLFDRQGQYQRTLLPYPASTPPERATGYSLLAGAGGLVPANKTSLYPVFANFGSEILPRLVDGQMVFVRSEARELNFFALDGTNRVRTVPMWPGKLAADVKSPSWLDIQVAFSPDGKTAYYSNLAGTAYDGKTPADIDPNWPQGRIYRHDVSKEGSVPEKFFDLALPDWQAAAEKYWMPSAWDKKTAAAGVDTDAAGNLYVCDLVNHEVVAISPAAKKLSATKVAWPDRVLASRKSDVLYVISRKVSRGAVPPATLLKISGRGDEAKVVAQVNLAGTIGGAATLDESGAVPVLWVAGQQDQSEKSNSQLWRIEDRGAELVVVDENGLNRDETAIEFVGYMDVDREAELVYVTRSGSVVWRYSGETGVGGRIPIKAVDVAIGPGGDIFTWGVGGWQGPIARYTRNLEPAPLYPGDDGAAEKRNTFGNLYGRAGRGQSVCGIDVDSAGRVYATFGSNECHVRVYEPDGRLAEFSRRATGGEERGRDAPAAITGVTGYGGSLRVDAAGNIYLLQAGVPKDFPVPPGFEKDEAFRLALGTIYKFPPAGGEVQTKNGTVNDVLGHVASYAGCGPVSRWNAVGACACTKPRFDVDGFGRLYIPNAITYSVSIRDNADNPIVQFGGYGNFDSQGPKSREPEPAIPLGWPVTAGASDRYVYIGDCLNHRVVRVDKRFATERVAALP